MVVWNASVRRCCHFTMDESLHQHRNQPKATLSKSGLIVNNSGKDLDESSLLIYEAAWQTCLLHVPVWNLAQVTWDRWRLVSDLWPQWRFFFFTWRKFGRIPPARGGGQGVMWDSNPLKPPRWSISCAVLRAWGEGLDARANERFVRCPPPLRFESNSAHSTPFKGGLPWGHNDPLCQACPGI